MKIKKKQPVPPLPVSRKVTRYRNISETSGYIPYEYLKPGLDCKKTIVIVDEQQSSSADE
jgi:hypothetical protein